MSIFTKSLVQLTLQDLQDLIDEQVPEGMRLDYKEIVHQKDASTKVDLCKTICAFANTYGGWVIIGMKEKVENQKNTGYPEVLSGLSTSQDEVKRQLNDLIRTWTEPVVQVQIQELRLDNGNFAFVVRIPKSHNGPHAHLEDDRRVLYKRHSAGNHHMDISEIRLAFGNFDNTMERMRQFHQQRIQELKKELSEKQGPPYLLMIHMLPSSAFEVGSIVDLTKLNDRAVVKKLATGIDTATKFTFDGFHVQTRDGGFMPAHILTETTLYRSGSAEIIYFDWTEGVILGRNLETVIIQRIERLLEVQKYIEVIYPIVGMITLMGLKDRTLSYPTQTWKWNGKPGHTTGDHLQLTPTPPQLCHCIDQWWFEHRHDSQTAWTQEFADHSALRRTDRLRY